jgi:hypothetical protein
MGCSAAITDHRLPGSSLDRLIPPGIKDDKSYRAITRIAATPGVRQVLEIGASSGGSSTDDVLRFRSAAGVHLFDAALIDGSETAGKPELDDTCGARFLLLDGICITVRTGCLTAPAAGSRRPSAGRRGCPR